MCETDPLYQYDYGQRLMFDNVELPDTYEVIFSNGVIKDGKTAIGGLDGVAIPDEFLTSGCNVMAWIFLHDAETDGEVEYVVRIPVRPRSKLSDQDITEEEHSIVSDLVAVVNAMREELDVATGRISELEETIADQAESLSALSDAIDEYKQRITYLENRTPALGGWLE